MGLALGLDDGSLLGFALGFGDEDGSELGLKDELGLALGCEGVKTRLGA